MPVDNTGIWSGVRVMSVIEPFIMPVWPGLQDTVSTHLLDRAHGSRSSCCGSSIVCNGCRWGQLRRECLLNESR